MKLDAPTRATIIAGAAPSRTHVRELAEAHIRDAEAEARAIPTPEGHPTREEMLGALRAIIYASDQCVGHAACGHSMDPWRVARALLDKADAEPASSPQPEGHNARSAGGE